MEHWRLANLPSSLCLSQGSSGAMSMAQKTRENRAFIHGADAPWLDSCEKHRNDGGCGEHQTP
jgi:hypothetical protein